MKKEKFTNSLLHVVKKLKVHPISILRVFIQVLSLILLNMLLFYDLVEPLNNYFIETYIIPNLNNVLSFLKTYLPELPIEQSAGSPFTTIPSAFDILQLRSTLPEFPFLELGVMFIIAALVGRGFCGWVCPFGLLQDVLEKVPTPKYRPTHSTNKELSEIKYIFLGFTLILITWVGLAKYTNSFEGLERALGYFSRVPWAAISPADTLESFIPWLIKKGSFTTLESPYDIFGWPTFFWIRIAFLAFVIILSLFIPRAYCRYICPVGAFMSIFSKYSMVVFKINPVRCTNCKECEKHCPMGVKFPDSGAIRSRECILCGRCMASCPEKAINLGLF
ncbi:MAG: 4Fe-4S binding protein [Candidatus Asgardarchaeia archaeon]